MVLLFLYWSEKSSGQTLTNLNMGAGHVHLLPVETCHSDIQYTPRYWLKHLRSTCIGMLMHSHPPIQIAYVCMYIVYTFIVLAYPKIGDVVTQRCPICTIHQPSIADVLRIRRAALCLRVWSRAGLKVDSVSITELCESVGCATCVVASINSIAQCQETDWQRNTYT